MTIGHERSESLEVMEGERTTAHYQQRPFCERVFEIGLKEYQPMKQHIRVLHVDDRARQSVFSSFSGTTTASG